MTRQGTRNCTSVSILASTFTNTTDVDQVYQRLKAFATLNPAV